MGGSSLNPSGEHLIRGEYLVFRVVRVFRGSNCAFQVLCSLRHWSLVIYLLPPSSRPSQTVEPVAGAGWNCGLKHAANQLSLDTASRPEGVGGNRGGFFQNAALTVRRPFNHEAPGGATNVQWDSGQLNLSRTVEN